jgi:hypothetical protein
VAVYGNVLLTLTLLTVVNDNKKLRRCEKGGRNGNPLEYHSVISVLGYEL